MSEKPNPPVTRLANLSFDHYLIRLVTMEDLDEYFQLIDKNRKRLEDFFSGTVAVTKTLEDTRVHLQDIIHKSETREFFSFLVVDTNTEIPIASLHVKSIDWKIPKAELGYFIDSDYVNKGIVTKALSLIIDYCFDELHLSKVLIRTHKENTASVRIAERNGFKLEGTIRSDYKTTAGVVMDLSYFGLLQHERFVSHRIHGNRGSFNYEPEGKHLGEMVYTMVNDHLMVIDHTEVDEKLKGQGIGKKLQQNLVDFVRLNNIKVIPVCPFAKTMFSRMREWQDVLREDAGSKG